MFLHKLSSGWLHHIANHGTCLPMPLLMMETEDLKRSIQVTYKVIRLIFKVFLGFLCLMENNFVDYTHRSSKPYSECKCYHIVEAETFVSTSFKNIEYRI